MNFPPSPRAAPVLSLAATALMLAGCPMKPAPQPKGAVSAPARPLALLVVDDAELGKAIAREWRARTEENLIVRDVSAADIANAGRLPGDAIVFPSGMIGQLAERGLILPLESALLEDADFNYRDIFDQIRLGEMRWGTKTWATPLGSPQLLLVYRADVFERLDLKPPSDWNEYQQAISRLSDRARLGDLAPAADQPWRATVEPLADGWAGQLLLARAASYAMHREQLSPLLRLDTAAPLLDQPPYVRALEELVSAAKDGGFRDLRLSPADVFAEIRDGRCAMAVTWPVNQGSANKETRQHLNLGVALLPGSHQAYRFATKTWEKRGDDDPTHVVLRSISGRMAAAAASSGDPRRAQGLVIWLSGRDVSQQVSPHSAATALFRQSQVASASRWTSSLTREVSRQYAEALAQTQSLPRGFGLTLPGRTEYLAALDEAVHAALDGHAASAALTEAVAKWTAITTKHGVEAQIRANARSLGQSDH